MKVLLDTHILLWWLADDPQLAEEHRVTISSAVNRIYVSAATVAEIAIMTSLASLTLLRRSVRQYGLVASASSR